MKRPLMVFGIPFLATVFALSYVTPMLTIIFAIMGVVSNYLMYKHKTMLVIIIISIVFAFNIFYNYQTNNIFETSQFDNLYGNITAQVLDKSPTSSGTNTAYTIEVLDSDIDNLPIGFNGILYADFAIPVDYYDIIQVNAICRHISTNESFDFNAYYQSIGILMQFFSYSTPDILEHNSTNLKYFLPYKIKMLNDNLCEIFDRYFNTEYSGMIKAMLLGNNNDLDDILYLNASRAGVTHIFVVSGLHIALLVGILLKFIDYHKLKHKKSLNKKYYQYILLIVVTWGLVLLTGFKISTIRAGIMMTFILLGVFFSRKPDSLNSLFGAGIVMIALAPYSITSISFQLSFSATLGIIVLASRFQHFFENFATSRLKHPLEFPPMLTIIINSISVTLSATIGMLPALIIIFKGLSVISLIANFMIVPLLPFVLVFGVLLLFFNFVPILSEIIYGITLLFLFIIKTLTNFLGGLRFAYIGLNFPVVYGYLIAVTVIIFTVILLKYFYKKFLVKFLTFFTLAVVISTYIINYNVVTITVFSNYKANSIVINNRSTANIINLYNTNDNDTNIASYLQSKNITKIENYVNFVETDIDTNNLLHLQQVTSITRMVNNIEYRANSQVKFDDISMYYTDKHRFFSKSGSYLDVFYEDATCVYGNISGLDILITNSIELANILKYDILFIETDETITPTNGKQVIYLTPNETDRKTVKLKL